MASDKETFESVHDIDALDRRAQEIQLLLRRIVEEDSIAELIRIWRKPGWTTPAEFFLVDGALTRIHREIEALEVDLQHLVNGAVQVGR